MYAKRLVLLVFEMDTGYKHEDQQDRYENHSAGRISRDQPQQESDMPLRSVNKYRYAFDKRIKQRLIAPQLLFCDGSWWLDHEFSVTAGLRLGSPALGT